MTIVYGGVDAFSAITAKFGREAGNVVLRAVAQFIKAVLRENEMLARVADDRFAIVLGGVDANETMAKVERILHAIEKCRLPVDGLARRSLHRPASASPKSKRATTPTC